MYLRGLMFYNVRLALSLVIDWLWLKRSANCNKISLYCSGVSIRGKLGNGKVGNGKLGNRKNWATGKFGNRFLWGR